MTGGGRDAAVETAAVTLTAEMTRTEEAEGADVGAAVSCFHHWQSCSRCCSSLQESKSV